MDLKLKRNRAIHLNAENEKVNGHCTWTYGERHFHVRVTPKNTIIAPSGKKNGNEWFPATSDTILTQLKLNEKLPRNHKREAEVFTGDRKKDKI